MPLSTKPKPSTIKILPLDQYDKIVVSFSGGKDSLACLLHLLEAGAPAEKIELWHQAVDGQPGAAERFFDWPVTEAYCRAASQALGIPLRFQWREGGFKGELLKGDIQPGFPFALHTSTLTSYFRFDDEGVWVTRYYDNATLFQTQDDAEAARALLPPEGTPVRRYFTPADMPDVPKKLKDEYAELIKRYERRQEIARGYKRAATVEKHLQKADEWLESQLNPALPEMRWINVVTPHASYQVGFELSPGGLEIGDVGYASGEGEPGVRLQFPSPSADLSARWCSAVLKIDAAAVAIPNDPASFPDGGKYLFITGERRQESNNRAKYPEAEPHRANAAKRRVDHWRPVLDYEEEAVWAIIERWRIRAHPAYYLGWGRLSCMSCIFGDRNQWAAVKQVEPNIFNTIHSYERRFGKTIQADISIDQMANEGTSFVVDDPAMIALAMGEELGPEYVILSEGETWILPEGAYKKHGGPT